MKSSIRISLYYTVDQLARFVNVLSMKYFAMNAVIEGMNGARWPTSCGLGVFSVPSVTALDCLPTQLTMFCVLSWHR